MSKPIEVNSFIIATTIAQLRTTSPRQGTNQMAVLYGSSGKFDSKGGFFVFDPTNTQADNGSTIIKVSGVSGAWLKVNRNQDPITLEQFGALVAGSFNKFITRGGTYATVKAALGTAGTTASTIVVAVNGVTVATITFGVGVTTTPTVTYASGTSFNVNDMDKVTFTVTAGTSAQNLALAIDF